MYYNFCRIHLKKIPECPEDRQPSASDITLHAGTAGPWTDQGKHECQPFSGRIENTPPGAIVEEDDMAFEPIYTITDAVTEALTRIERARGFLEAARLSEDWIAGMQRRALVQEGATNRRYYRLGKV